MVARSRSITDRVTLVELAGLGPAMTRERPDLVTGSDRRVCAQTR
jgi:hypothetical protein